MSAALASTRALRGNGSLTGAKTYTKRASALASLSSTLLHNSLSFRTLHTPPTRPIRTPFRTTPLSQTPRLLVHHTQTRHNSGGGFFSEFARSIKRQWAENRELQQNVKQLSAETNKLAESDMVQGAKKAMETGAKGTSKVVEKLGDAVDSTLQNPVVKKTGEAIYTAGEKVADVTQKVAEPILDTQAAKIVEKGIKQIKKNVVDTGSSAYFAEYKPREVRERERAEQIAEQSGGIPIGIPGVVNPHRVVAADPEAGASVVTHRSSRLAESWRKFKEESPIAQKLFSVRRGFEESDHPLVERVRDFFTSAAFEETEQAQVVRAIKVVDPSFRLDKFLKEATTYMIPEIMEAYLKGEAHILRDWCGERAYARLTAGFEAQRTQGLISDCKLLDLRRVDIRKLTLLEDEIPVILVTFTTHEILMFRNKKGELKLGKEDHIEMATYVMAFTKAQAVDPSVEINPKTGGWVVIDWSRSTGW
ncbi:protein translocase subunit [Borealophlyctis nickersoniae]|nr:protein translocase subunit [Borealophlyctis nickersoniae]